MILSFNFSTLPSIHFGPDSMNKAPGLIKKHGKTLLLVTGKSSFQSSTWGPKLIDTLKSSGIQLEIVNIHGDPTTGQIDAIAKNYRTRPPSVVMSIGGGSVIDAGKAISAMITTTGETWDYLEGNPSTKPHPGTKIPFVAAPTNAGTGSEATKNAVITTTNPAGYKRSLRHDAFIPDIAIVDPCLALDCPATVSAASGLDALTQLLEAYSSTQASPLTDALAWSGLEQAVKYLETTVKEPGNLEARSGMAYAALNSGIVLANAGLGAIHGFASVLGGHHDIPHGVVCGTLLGATTRKNINKLLEENRDQAMMDKLARVGKLFCGDKDHSREYYLLSLADALDRLVIDLNIPRLSSFGVKKENLPSLAAETGIKNNPVKLDSSELEKILLSRL
jgi:alcohol dehydrogenase